ncbi:type IV secretory system conjugative DNA transfer family protein [Subtercola frigoramans]
MHSAALVSVRPASLPLSTHDPVGVARSLYSAFARKYKTNEAAVMQLVLGPGVPPRTVPPKIKDPRGMTVVQALTVGQRDASSEDRTRVRDRAAHYGLSCELRIGVTAPTPERRERFALELLAGLSVAQAPGVHLDLVRIAASRIDMSSIPRRWSLRLSVPELVPLTGWPVGDGHLPGMPPLHPKVMRAAASVHTGPRVFAQALAPGDSRFLGFDAAAALYHAFAIGPTGVGKTTLMQHLIERDIESGGAVLVIDPKAQIPQFIRGRIPEERWEDVVEIDPTDDNPVGFNPLDASGRDPDVVADSILAVFKKIFSEGWGPRTADIFSASLRTLARSGTVDYPNTLMDLPTLWTDPAYRARQVGAVSGDIALAGFWAWFDDLKPSQQALVIASPMNKLRSILLRPAVVKILGQRHPAFRLRNIFRERKIVLLPLNEGLVGPLTADLLGSLVLAETWQAAQERASEKDHATWPGFVYVDEADRFMNGSLSVSLAEALARSRSLSVSWFLATQFWDQLPKEMKSAVRSNARTKIAFKMESDEDAHTFARLAPELTAEDFMSLAKFEIYVKLVADGVTTDWALAKTLPPSRQISDPAEVLRVSRQHHQAVAAAANASSTDLVAPGALTPTSTSPAPATPPAGAIGRRRRNR